MKTNIQKRPGKGGRIALRLEHYNGYERLPDGKLRLFRKYENLNLYLKANPKTPAEKNHNKEALRLAEAIRAKRLVEAQSSKHGFIDHSKAQASFVAYFQKMIDAKAGGSRSRHSIWCAALKHLQGYSGQHDLTFAQITPEFLEGFRRYLLTQPITKSHQPLSKNSASTYFNKVRCALNEAVRSGVIAESPAKGVGRIAAEHNRREYLTLDEVKALVATHCRYPVLKRAFLFSCVTGLRWSDIQKLTWADVEQFNGSCRVVFKQQKTNGLQYLDVSPQALRLIGEAGAKGERVFRGLRYSAYHNTELLRWCMAAGISKHITFHSGRHTFAVTQLSLGTDIYTVSKLLGHTEIRTTQIYADIIDSRRKLAMHAIPDLGL